MKQRLLYIDVLRGIAMLMVVYSHILTFSMGSITPSPIGKYFCDIMLPLFFFVSGFCAYKGNRTWSIKKLFAQYLRKVRGILLPTVVMFLLFVFYSNKDIISNVFSYDKSGYWFTWVLFQVMIIFFAFDYFASKQTHIWMKVIITLSPLLLFQLVFMFVDINNTAGIIFEWTKVKYYYLFFLLGVFAHQFSVTLHKILNNPVANAGLLLFALGSYYLGITDLRYFVIVSNLMMIYFLAYAIGEKYDYRQSKVSKLVITIGMNSLEIYFIHFFLLFRIPVVPQYLESLKIDMCAGTHSCSSIVEFLFCFIISLILCVASIAIKRIIHFFPIVSEMCFGPRREE